MYYTESAEYLFASEALGLGYLPCWPSAEAVPFDMLLYKEGRSITIQVKTCRKPDRQGSYSPEIRHSAPGKNKRKYYSASEVDFVAVYLIQDGAWYIFPISVLQKRIRLRPHDLENCKYKEHFEA